MDARNLRIGNWVVIDGSKEEICDNIMFDYDEGAWYIDNRHITLVKPIPLTEEWLLRFGFKREKEEHINNQYRNNRMILELDVNDKLTYSFGDADSVAVIYVNQLQNLYFALTGEELEFNKLN